MSTLHQPIRNLRNYKRFAEQQLENDNRPHKQQKNINTLQSQILEKNGITKSKRAALTNISNTHTHNKSSTLLNKKEVKIVKEVTKTVHTTEGVQTEEQGVLTRAQRRALDEEENSMGVDNRQSDEKEDIVKKTYITRNKAAELDIDIKDELEHRPSDEEELDDEDENITVETRSTRSKVQQYQEEMDEQDEEEPILSFEEEQISCTEKASVESEPADPHKPAVHSPDTVRRRISQWLKSSGVENNHKTDSHAEYHSHIHSHLLATESIDAPSPDYLTTFQNDITPNMRSILIDWLVEVAQEYHLQQQTLFLSVSYIDRFLNKVQVDRSRLQLIGVTAMLLASKYWEIYPPTIEDYCYITDHTYNRIQVVEMEASILVALKFGLTTPTVFDFSRRLLRLKYEYDTTNEDTCLRCYTLDQLRWHVDYLCELMMCTELFLKYKPSIVASSAVYLALHTESIHPVWTNQLKYESGHTISDLFECINDTYNIYVRSHTTESNLRAVKEKYSKEKYGKIAIKYHPVDLPKILKH